MDFIILNNNNMAQGLTFEQLQGMGAKPAQPTGLTLAQVLAQQKASAQTPTDNRDLLQKTGDVVNSIFPGKQTGQAIGTLAGLGYEKVKGLFGGKDNSKYYDTSAPSPLQVGGDIAQGALTVAAPEIGNGPTALGRIGSNAALGAGLGGTNAIAEGKGLKDTAESAALGGAIGGGVSAVGEGIKSLTENLPKWLTKLALPKLDKENIPYAIENTPVGSLNKIQKSSEKAIGNYEDSVQSILNHPEFKGVAEDTGQILDSAVNKFPNSNYTPEDILDNAKDIAPKVGKLLDKFDAGQANLQEINTIRKELDQATKSVYTSLNRPPEAKLLGATLADAMRTYVKTSAPETVPIFDNYAKEMGLNKAIDTAVTKGEQKIRLGDIAAATAGFAKGGLSGALEAIIGERLLTNPAAQLAGAKAIQGISKIATPIAETAFQGLKAPIIKKVTQ